MNRRKGSISRLLPSTSIPRLGEKGKERVVVTTPMQLPRRRSSTVRAASNEDSTGSEQQSSTSHPQTPTSASAKLLRMTSKVGLGSLDTSSNSSLRSISKPLPNPPGSPVQSKNSFRSKAPKPLKLDDGTTAFNFGQQHPDSREATTPPYEGQFRRRRGDLLHRLGSSVPYMQTYGPTSLQW